MPALFVEIIETGTVNESGPQVRVAEAFLVPLSVGVAVMLI